MDNPRTNKDLKANAVLFWPSELVRAEEKCSIIPLLIKTQDKFISILHVSDKSPTSWKSVLSTTKHFATNLFLKHLIILTDLGGEKLKRFKSELPAVFQDNKMYFAWGGKEFVHEFETLGKKCSWDNKNLAIDGATILKPTDLTPAMEDVIMILMHGAASTNPGLPDVIGNRCVIGTLLGDKAALDTFVRQRYIWVSRITGGATANTLGNLAQNYVKERLQTILPNWDFSQRSIPGISQNAGRTNIAFDIVGQSPKGVYCAVEVSFQVTTNSVIERKAGQAHARQSLLHNFNHYIAYVIDGAGNFERSSALSTICQYSDCTVSFRDSEIQELANYLGDIGKQR